MTDLAQDLLALARSVADEAAGLVAARRRDGVEVAATKSSVVDVVTDADRACEELIRARIAAARPDDAFLGEEGDDVVGTSGVRWIVDPIDGTVNYVYGIPSYAVSIAAEVDGVVVAGVVRNVATGTEYVAHLGGGSARDGVPLRVRPTVPVEQRLVATGFGYEARVRAVQASALVGLLPQVRDIRRLGSCALDLCALAEGSVDAYLEEGVNLWDHAAGSLIAAEAGARIEVRPGRWGGVALLAAPADGFDAMAALVESVGYFTGPVGE